LRVFYIFNLQMSAQGERGHADSEKAVTHRSEKNFEKTPLCLLLLIRAVVNFLLAERLAVVALERILQSLSPIDKGLIRDDGANLTSGPIRGEQMSKIKMDKEPVKA